MNYNTTDFYIIPMLYSSLRIRVSVSTFLFKSHGVRLWTYDRVIVILSMPRATPSSDLLDIAAHCGEDIISGTERWNALWLGSWRNRSSVIGRYNPQNTAECYDQFPEHVRQLYRINYGYLVRVRVGLRLGIGLGLGFRSGKSQCVPPFHSCKIRNETQSFRSVPEIIPTPPSLRTFEKE